MSMYDPPHEAPWYCHDVEGEGMSWHATYAEALAHAQTCLDVWQSTDGWPSEAGSVYVGRVLAQSAQVEKLRCTSACHGPHDFHCAMAMRPMGTPEELLPPAMVDPYGILSMAWSDVEMLAYTLGLAPTSVRPMLCDDGHTSLAITNSQGVFMAPWVPHLHISQARELFYEHLKADGWRSRIEISHRTRTGFVQAFPLLPEVDYCIHWPGPYAEVEAEALVRCGVLIAVFISPPLLIPC